MTKQISNNFPDRILDGKPPYFERIYEVIYITRGRDIPPGMKPISMHEWMDVIIRHTDIELDECYDQYNIDRGVNELWKEVGRAKWIKAPNAKEEHLHFSFAQIEYLHGGPFRGGRLRDKYLSINRKLDGKRTIDAWLELIDKDPWLELDEASGETGRANWVDKKGNIKGFFRFTPASIWIYKNLDGYIKKRLELCSNIASLLDAKVWDGL